MSVAISVAISGPDTVGERPALPVSERPAHFSCKYRDYCRFDLAVDVCKGILSVELHHGLPHSLCLPQTSRRRASARCERVASF